MKHFPWLAFAILTPSCDGVAPDSTVAALRPDLLVITVGELGPAALEPSERASLELPVLDALLGGGVNFSNAVIPSAQPDASLASLFTGLHPRRHGALFFFYGLDEEHETLAEHLRVAGYRTGGFTVSTPSAESKGFDQGFDVFEAPSSADIDILRWAWPNERIVTSAAAWLRAAQQEDESWFCWIHLNVPSMLGKELSSAQVRNLPSEVAHSPSFQAFRNGQIPDQSAYMTEVEPWLYRLALVGLDEDLAPLASALGGRPRVTLFTALRGEPGPGSPVPLLEAMWHVPFVLAGARGVVSGSDERPASLLDVMATLLGQAGIPSTSPDDGLDLLGSGATNASERLFVHDDYDLRGETHVAVRLGERLVWVRGKYEGISMRWPDLADPLTEEDVAELRTAYAAWSTARPDLALLRRPELDAEWQRAAEEEMLEIERELGRRR